MLISTKRHQQLRARVARMDRIRSPWVKTWREISDYFLPRRYPWLATQGESKSADIRNRRLLDSTSILALRTLATGLMNGITSPARPWFRLRLLGREQEEIPHDALVWLEEATKRMLLVMAESNFYNALGVMYLELSAFGTASLGIYEDFDTVIRAQNDPVGSFYISSDENGRVNRHAKKFRLTVEQAAAKFGAENLPQVRQQDLAAGMPRAANPLDIWHLIEPNDDDEPQVRASARYRELYWIDGEPESQLLAARPLNEFPKITPRWETYADDEYGSSPSMDALPDVISLQHLIKRRAQALDKTITPPMLVNQMLANKPKSMIAGGVTYVAGQDLNSGARPAFQIQVPFDHLAQDIVSLRTSIERVLFNDLFRMISQLDTVRSATEIDARREEKLVLLGPVLERFESEALSPAIERVFAICDRAGIFPPPPESLSEAEVQVQYVSILSDAQSAIGTVSVERWLQLIGNVAQMAPDEALDIPDWEELIREYANDIGVKQKLSRSRDEVVQRKQAREEAKAQQAAVETGQQLASGAESLSNTDVGGGQNALQRLIGG